MERPEATRGFDLVHQEEMHSAFQFKEHVRNQSPLQIRSTENISSVIATAVHRRSQSQRNSLHSSTVRIA